MKLNWTAVVTATIGLLGSIMVAYITASFQTDRKTAEITGWPSNKICSVYVPSQFRDNLLVPLNWTSTVCKNLATKIGATHYQLGCIEKEDLVFGDPDGQGPPQNCGW